MKPWLLRCGLAAGWAIAVALSPAAAQPAALPASQVAGRSCPPPTAAPTPAQLQAAAAQARDRGLLWRLVRDGRTSYLYASIHVGKLEWAFPGPQLRAALRTTDTLALELDVSDAQIVARMKASEGSVPPALASVLRERLARQADAACVPIELLAALHPVMQAVSLAVLAARWQGLEPGYAQEFVLSGLAHAAQRRVVSLETPESQMAALIPKDPAEAERMVVQLLDQLEQGSVQRMIGRLATAWARGDLAEIGDYERWCDCIAGDEDRAQLRRLNDERNPGLADGIAALHHEGRSVLAAVGALHMTGAQALPLLLAQRGFTVERIALQTLP